MNERRADFELLRAFARAGDQKALADVIRRHLDLVFATAVRKVSDAGAAEEISQNVFSALARKAWQFAPDDSLPAWLHKTTLLESKSWLRSELRRRRREQTAAELGTTMKTPEDQPAFNALVPLLDEALLSLREKDRTALLLRFYQSQSLRDVGASLGVGEDAAQKRVQSALEKLSQFFKRRGFKTATVAASAAVLQHTAASASAATASAVVNATLQAVPPAVTGLGALFARFASLTKAQAAMLTVAVAAGPVLWQWDKAQAAEKLAGQTQMETAKALTEHEKNLPELERLRAEAKRLDVELASAATEQTRRMAAAQKLDELKRRIRGLLTEANYHWPDDLPYIRIPKSVVMKLEMQGMFSSSGEIADKALEMLGITPEEKLPVERALGDYWKGVRDLMSAHAYETNALGQPAGRVAKTVIVPPLGQELKTLAENTSDQITQHLGEERGKKMFGGWDAGAIQLFWPGNLWTISENPQTITVWIEPVTDGKEARFLGSWYSSEGGIGPDAALIGAPFFPREITAKFFDPWLRQYGITNTVSLNQP